MKCKSFQNSFHLQEKYTIPQNCENCFEALHPHFTKICLSQRAQVCKVMKANNLGHLGHKNKYYYQTYFVHVLLTKTTAGKTLFKRCKGLQKIYFMLFIHRCGAMKQGRLLMVPIIILLLCCTQ